MALLCGRRWYGMCRKNGMCRKKINPLLVASTQRYTTTTIYDTEFKLPTHARVVICGGGILGSSVAYHLAYMGWKDIVLLEQGKFTCGTTWHSVGLIGQMSKDDVGNCKMIQYSRDLYKRFETMGEHVGWKECGSLLLAQTKDRLIALRRKQAIAKAAGLESFILSPFEVRDHCNWVKIDDLEGGLYIPSDGVLTAPDVNITFTKLSKRNGVKMFENVAVEQVLTTNGRISGVETSHGNIKCDVFVNCSGLWSRETGQKSQPIVKVPLHACEHFYITTTPIPEMDSMLPVIRDYDGLVYFREWSGGIMAGGFEPVGKPTFHEKVPDGFQFQLLPDDWDHFQVLLDSIVHRIPAMENANVQKMFNGPESFTPDGNWLVGEVPEIDNYFIAAGMGGTGIVAAGGIGQYLSEWIIYGQPSTDLSQHDIRRFVAEHNDKVFLRDRVKETLGMYTMKYPTQQWESGRCLIKSPLHNILEKAGACFIADPNGFETPAWFSKDFHNSCPYNIPRGEGTFTKPYWFSAVQGEIIALKENVGIADTSSFTKIEIQGPGVVDFLEYLTYNDVDLAEGCLTYTGMLDSIGRFQVECTVVRLQKEKYLILAPSSRHTHTMSWIRKQCTQKGISIKDMTKDISCISLVGPASSSLLYELFTSKLKGLQIMTAKKVSVRGMDDIMVMRTDGCGVDEIQILVHNKSASIIYKMLLDIGEKHGICHTGHYALKMINVENFTTKMGCHLSYQTTPYESGRGQNISFKDKDFIGREALMGMKDECARQRLCQLSLIHHDKDSDPWPWGGEPIYRNGKFCGTVSTCGYSSNTDEIICIGYVGTSGWKNKTDYEIDINGKLWSAHLTRT